MSQLFLQNCLCFKLTPNFYSSTAKVSKKCVSWLCVQDTELVFSTTNKSSLELLWEWPRNVLHPYKLHCCYFCLSILVEFYQSTQANSFNLWAKIQWMSLVIPADCPKLPSWHESTISGRAAWCFMVGQVAFVLLLTTCFWEPKKIAEASQGKSSVHSAGGDE